MRALLVVLALQLGCAQRPPISAEGVEVASVATALVRITAAGPRPAELRLSTQRAVMFLNATGQEPLTVVVRGALPEWRLAGIARGFGQRGAQTITDPPLPPGAVAVLSVPPGADLTFDVQGLGRAYRGRVLRAESR